MEKLIKRQERKEKMKSGFEVVCHISRLPLLTFQFKQTIHWLPDTPSLGIHGDGSAAQKIGKNYMGGQRKQCIDRQMGSIRVELGREWLNMCNLQFLLFLEKENTYMTIHHANMLATFQYNIEQMRHLWWSCKYILLAFKHLELSTSCQLTVWAIISIGIHLLNSVTGTGV